MAQVTTTLPCTLNEASQPHFRICSPCAPAEARWWFSIIGREIWREIFGPTKYSGRKTHPKFRNTKKTPRLHELFRKVRTNFSLLSCDMSQEPNGNCSAKLVQRSFFISGGFFRADFPPLKVKAQKLPGKYRSIFRENIHASIKSFVPTSFCKRATLSIWCLHCPRVCSVESPLRPLFFWGGGGGWEGPSAFSAFSCAMFESLWLWKSDRPASMWPALSQNPVKGGFAKVFRQWESFQVLYRQT